MKSEQTNYGKIGRSEFYIEELFPGSIFEWNNDIYVLTHDFKKNSSRLTVSVSTGSTQWMAPETIVKFIDLYKIADDNFVRIKNSNENIRQD